MLQSSVFGMIRMSMISRRPAFDLESLPLHRGTS